MTVPEISARSFALLLLLLAVASIVAFAFKEASSIIRNLLI